MSPRAADDLLRLLLRLSGGVELCAIPFVLFPLGWMDAVHARLGLGELPRGAVVEYMARSLSALYAAHGAVVFRLSFDVARFRPVIGFLGGVHAAFGLAVLGIDLASDMPWFWTVAEGPGITAGGILMWLLARAGGRGTAQAG